MLIVSKIVKAALNHSVIVFGSEISPDLLKSLRVLSLILVIRTWLNFIVDSMKSSRVLIYFQLEFNKDILIISYAKGKTKTLSSDNSI